MEPRNKKKEFRQVFIGWLAIYPLITGLIYLLADVLATIPVFLQTFILTVITAPLISWFILPFYQRIFRKWL